MTHNTLNIELAFAQPGDIYEGSEWVVLSLPSVITGGYSSFFGGVQTQGIRWRHITEVGVSVTSLFIASISVVKSPECALPCEALGARGNMDSEDVGKQRACTIQIQSDLASMRLLVQLLCYMCSSLLLCETTYLPIDFPITASRAYLDFWNREKRNQLFRQKGHHRVKTKNVQVRTRKCGLLL